MSAVKHEIDLSGFTLQQEETQWHSGEIPVLSAVLSVPRWSKPPHSRAERRLARYYAQYRRAFLSYCRQDLYPRALEEFRAAQQRSAPFSCARASLRCRITYRDTRLLSLYLDCTEWEHTARALTLRRADTWELSTGTLLSARDCFPRGSAIRHQCFSAALAQCRAAEDAGRSAYLPHLSFRLRRHLNLRNFYLTPEGFHFFYQPYAIAPAFEGCPDFFLPFSEENGPFLPCEK